MIKVIIVKIVNKLKLSRLYFSIELQMPGNKIKLTQ